MAVRASPVPNRGLGLRTAGRPREGHLRAPEEMPLYRAALLKPAELTCTRQEDELSFLGVDLTH